MEAIISEIKRFAVHDGDGIRTTVFLKGCPLRCLWCHNPEGLSSRAEMAYYENKCIGCGECVKVCPTGAQTVINGAHVFDREKCIACGRCREVCFGEALVYYGKRMSTEELLPKLLEDRDFYESSGGGVTLSGGECLIHADFCRELLSALKKEGINTAVDTSGCVPFSAIEKVLPYTDVFLYDMKAVDSAIHKRCTGVDNALILENIKKIDDAGGKIEVRIPFVPEYNDGEMESIAKLLCSIKNLTKLRVLPYHNYAGSKYASLGLNADMPKRLPTDEEIKSAKELFKACGLNVVE